MRHLYYILEWVRFILWKVLSLLILITALPLEFLVLYFGAKLDKTDNETFGSLLREEFCIWNGWCWELLPKPKLRSKRRD